MTSYSFIFTKSSDGWDAECIETGHSSFGTTLLQAAIELAEDISYSSNTDFSDDDMLVDEEDSDE